MSEMSSFYGGRQGSSFVIVKRFDGIDIPQSAGHEIYTNKSYAVEGVNGIFILTTKAQGGNVAIDAANDVYLIEKTGSNKENYTWVNHFNNGGQINNTVYNFPTELAQGMVQCFAKGAKSASEVNYGEYVIIDTEFGMNDYVNPENGKIFRRGMDISAPLAGAEYIGQVTGPKGDTIELDYNHYDTLISGPVRGFGQYDLDNGDLIFGSSIDPVTGDRLYEDVIRYAYVTIKDEYNNVSGSVIGFKIPVMVEDYEATSMSPYQQRAVDPITGKYYNYDLISPDPTQYINDEWQHPFYQKWQIKIPSGYHGANVTNLQIAPTKTMPIGYTEHTENGVNVYSDRGLINQIAVITTEYSTVLASYDPDATWVEITYNGNPAYVAREDCYKDVMRYKKTNFDNVEIGESVFHQIGYVDTIERISISNDGYLYIYYKGKNGVQQINDSPIPWITSATLTQNGAFDIYYNNDVIQNGHYHNTLNWVDMISVEADGTVNFYYSSDHTTPAFRQSKFLKFIEDADIQTIATGSNLEGTGDQKIHLTYNITDSLGRPVEEAIGNPLNYIIETAISNPNEYYPTAPYSHLLVYYSDPALRAQYQNKWVRWPSSKYPGQIWTEWVDLGLVRGAAGGMHILKDVQSLDDLKDGHGDYIPPELLEDDEEHVINPNAAGWSCSLTVWEYVETTSTDPEALLIVADGTTPLLPNQIEISTVEELSPGEFQVGDYVKKQKARSTEVLFYNYESHEWYSIGPLDIASVDPRYIIVKSAPEPGTTTPNPSDVGLLNPNGFWLASQYVKSAY